MPAKKGGWQEGAASVSKEYKVGRGMTLPHSKNTQHTTSRGNPTFSLICYDPNPTPTPGDIRADVAPAPLQPIPQFSRTYPSSSPQATAPITTKPRGPNQSNTDRQGPSETQPGIDNSPLLLESQSSTSGQWDRSICPAATWTASGHDTMDQDMSSPPPPPSSDKLRAVTLLPRWLYFRCSVCF